jgi:hypothetical protein
MSSLEFFRTLRDFTPERRFAAYLDYKLAPVRDGAKPAELLTFCPSLYDLHGTWKVKGKRIVTGMGLSVCTLKEREDCACLLIYDAGTLSRCLDLHWNAPLLRDAGYHTFTTEAYLANLKERFQQSCPHEIGLFLGIPYDDVVGFIRNDGKNSLFDGYWKVYSKPERAKAIFRKYDVAKERSLRSFVV